VLNTSVAIIKAFDMAILPLGIVLSLAQYVYYMLLNVVHPNSSGPLFRKPANDHTAWAARILMFCGVKLALVFGYAAFEILEQSGLARVKTVEYLIIVVPIQINIGMILGGVMQWKMEQRILKKQFARKNAAAKMEEGTKGEKEGLLVEA
jgi:hypothetical protein